MPLTTDSNPRFLTGRTAIVTGSTSGIGLAIATSLALAGARVMIDSIDDDAILKATAESIHKQSDSPVAYSRADMSKPDDILALVAQTEKEFGTIDIIVNNVGIQHVSPIEDFPIEKWNLILALNLSASFHLTRATLKGMKERKWGRVISIASAHGKVASPFKSAYVSAKHGLVGLMKTVALEAAEHGVTANTISPGYVWTPLVEKQIPDTMAARGLTREQVIQDVLLHAQPTKQFVTVEQVAALATFLCSEAASQITGSDISMDGGWTAQ
jgi:3-hydroxybutyrate dehydrogenase